MIWIFVEDDRLVATSTQSTNVPFRSKLTGWISNIDTSGLEEILEKRKIAELIIVGVKSDELSSPEAMYLDFGLMSFVSTCISHLRNIPGVTVQVSSSRSPT